MWRRSRGGSGSRMRKEGRYLGQLRYHRLRLVKGGVALRELQGTLVPGKEDCAKANLGGRLNILEGVISEIERFVDRDAMVREEITHGLVESKTRFCGPELIGKKAELFREAEGGQATAKKGGEQERSVELSVRDDSEDQPLSLQEFD